MRVERRTLKSVHLGEDINVNISSPGMDAPVHEVMVLLDGEALFDYVSATVEYYSMSLRAPPIIVAGLEVRDRVRCFSPTQVLDHEFGVEAFTEALADEVVPLIERLVGPTHMWTLVGHSLGGMYALYSMLGCSGVFDAWVVLSPPITSYGAYLDEAMRGCASIRGSLFVAVDGAGDENVEAAGELVEGFRVRDGSLRAMYKIYGDADHFTVVPRAFPEALEFIVPVLAHRHE